MNQLRYYDNNTGRTTYIYDANGNERSSRVSSGGVTTNLWDFENKLKTRVMASGARSTYTYDPDGKLIRKDSISGTSKYLWDLDNILLEADASDVIQAIYSLMPELYGRVVSQFRVGSTSFFHFDALGSTDKLTDNLGGVTDSYLYRAFGGCVTLVGATTNPFRYGGGLQYYFDIELAGYYVRERIYNHAIARWVSRDPLRDADGPHLYLYCHNRPTVALDPSGTGTVAVDKCSEEVAKIMRAAFKKMCDKVKNDPNCLPKGDALTTCLQRLCAADGPSFKIVCEDGKTDKTCQSAPPGSYGGAYVMPPTLDEDGNKIPGEIVYANACSPVTPDPSVKDLPTAEPIGGKPGKPTLKPKPPGKPLTIHVCVYNGNSGVPLQEAFLHELVHLCSLPQGEPAGFHKISEGCVKRCYPKYKSDGPANPEDCKCPC